MATSPRLSIAAAEAMLNALGTAFDAGTAAVIQIYTGAQPAYPDTAVSTQTLLSTLVMSATSFGSATNASPGALITANTITADSSAAATGTAAWFRISTQSGGTAVFDGSVGTSAADLILNTTSIVAGATVLISSATITMPQS